MDLSNHLSYDDDDDDDDDDDPLDTTSQGRHVGITPTDKCTITLSA